MVATLTIDNSVAEFPISEALEYMIIHMKEAAIMKERLFPRTYDPTPQARLLLFYIEEKISRLENDNKC